MRISIKPGRSRVLAIAATVLLSGTALAAATMPAQAAQALPSAVDPITVTALPTAAATAGTAADIAVSATDSAGLAVTFTAADLPLSGDLAIAAAGTTTIDPITGVATTTDAITGTPTAADVGTYTVVVTADDADGNTATADITLTITAATAPVTVTVTVPADQTTPAGTAITPVTVTAAGGVAPYTYTETGLPLPAGALDEETGEISGTPTAAGIAGSPHTVTITATDADGDFGTNTFTWTITAASAVKVTAPAESQVWTGIAADIKPKATDTAAKPALTWGATGLPPGLNISETTGAITGRPSKAGKYDAVKLTATDATTGHAGTLTVAIDVSYPFDIPNPGTQTTTVGEGLDLRFGSDDELKGIKVTSLSAENLPAGMGLHANPAMLYGWPTEAGTYAVVINGSGTSGATSTMTFKLVVKPAPDSGATGQVHLALGGKCLLDPGGKTAFGTKAEISKCVSGSTEKWTVASDGTLRVNGRCLDISGTGSYSGQVAELWSCDGSAREQWAQGTDGELVNPPSGVCLTDPGSATRNGTVVQTGACRVKSNEQWTLPAQSILTALGGSCADDYHSADTKVDMFWCNGTVGQTWIFEPNGTIRPSQYPGSCFTVHGSEILLAGCAAPTKEQRWSVSHTGGLASEITLGGACLSIRSLTAANGTALVTAQCTAGNPNVHWHIW